MMIDLAKKSSINENVTGWCYKVMHKYVHRVHNIYVYIDLSI